MIVTYCDICRKPIENYREPSGKIWASVSFQEKKYRRRVCFFADTWTEYMSVCGFCRKALSDAREEAEHETD